MDINDDIEDILREDPIENKPKIQTYGKAKKMNIFSKLGSNKKKVIISVGIILVVITIGFLFLIPNSCECEVCTICGECIQNISIENIKQQIISQGYAELTDGDKLLKLSPYTG